MSSQSPALTRPSESAQDRSERHLAWLFLSPALLLVAGISALPVAQALFYSTFRTAYLERTSFVGFLQYTEALSDPRFLQNVVSTTAFTFWSLVFAIPLGTVAAIVLNQPIRFGVAFRTMLLLPWMMSQLVTGLLWSWLVNALDGPVPYLLDVIGIAHGDLLSSRIGAMAVLVTANVWHSYGFVTVLLLGALQTIPRELYEAAECDGAGAWQCFRWVTLPFLFQPLMVAAIMQTLNDVNAVVLPLVLTGGGPFNATEVLGLRVYKEAFEQWHIGPAAAVSFMMFIINMVISIGYIRLLKRRAGDSQ